MKAKNSKVAMNCVGTALAVCSTVAFVGANCVKSGACKTRKTIKKTAGKIANVIDSVVDAI